MQKPAVTNVGVDKRALFICLMLAKWGSSHASNMSGVSPKRLLCAIQSWGNYYSQTWPKHSHILPLSTEEWLHYWELVVYNHFYKMSAFSI